MFAGLSTPSTSAEGGAFALLQLVADPAAAKKRLEEMTQAAVAAEEAEKKARATIESAEAATAKLEGREAELQAREKAVEARERAVTAREMRWEETKRAISAKVAEVA